jgi:hypothetical protein
MTITFTLTDGQQGNLLAEMEQLFEHSAIALAQAINQINAGNHDPAKAAAAASKELRSSLDTIMAERTKLEKYSKSGVGGREGGPREVGPRESASSGSGALELDAARDEIGRRLACLRGARAGGGVSGGAE